MRPRRTGRLARVMITDMPITPWGTGRTNMANMGTALCISARRVSFWMILSAHCSQMACLSPNFDARDFALDTGLQTTYSPIY